MAAHVEADLVPLLGGELPPAQAAAVQAHLETCADCRAALDDFRRLASELGRGALEPPPIHWGAYRAELRDRIEGRGRRARRSRLWSATPLRGAVAAGLIAILVYVGAPGRLEMPPSAGVDHAALDEAILSGHLELIAGLDLVQRLDLLEDLDVIGRLDRLPARSDG